MSDRLTRRLLDAQGRPSRTARRAAAATVAAAFVLAFVIALGSHSTEAGPRADHRSALRAAPPADRAPAAARLHGVAPLPDLRRDPARPAASTSPDTGVAPPTTPPPAAPPPPAQPAPAPTVSAPPPAASAPPPTPSAPEHEAPQPEPSFDTSGEFDSSG